MTLTIRPYQDTDVAAVLASWEKASSVAHPFLSEAFLEQERYNIPNVYLPNAETWVAEHEEGVVGFLALIGGEVGAIFVQPEDHGKGIGKALMDKARSLRGDLEVEVFAANNIGRRFYQRYGFELQEEKWHEATGQAVLRLRYRAPMPT